MITISEKAHSYIKKDLDEHLPRSTNEIIGRGNVPHARLGVQDYQEKWGGYKYLFFEDTWQAGDITLDFTDYIILVHQEHAQLVNGLHIDYREEGLQKRLDFMNPNDEFQTTCGCGTAHEFDNVKFAGIEKKEPLDIESLLNNTTVEEDNEDIVSESEGT
jgi:Fe-S cluster assembly iron-binding protein IscA